jgi:hypothetical protein
MLMMESPSIVFNAHDAPGPIYRMWKTVNAPKGYTAHQCVQAIVAANSEAVNVMGAPLKNIIVNCHGADGGGALYIGGAEDRSNRINADSVGAFTALKSLNLGTIWLVACEAATGPLGKALCQSMTTFSGCQVVAADENQSTGVWGSWRLITTARHNQIDEFEGAVFSFTVRGGMRKIDPHDAIYTIME